MANVESPPSASTTVTRGAERPKAPETKLSDPGPVDVDEFSLDGRILEFPTQDEADAIAESRIGIADFDAELAKLRAEIERGR